MEALSAFTAAAASGTFTPPSSPVPQPATGAGAGLMNLLTSFVPGLTHNPLLKLVIAGATLVANYDGLAKAAVFAFGSYSASNMIRLAFGTTYKIAMELIAVLAAQLSPGVVVFCGAGLLYNRLYPKMSKSERRRWAYFICGIGMFTIVMTVVEKYINPNSTDGVANDVLKRINDLQRSEVTKSKSSKIILHNDTRSPIEVEGNHPVPGYRYVTHPFGIGGGGVHKETLQPNEVKVISGGWASFGVGSGVRLCQFGKCVYHEHGDVVKASELSFV